MTLQYVMTAAEDSTLTTSFRCAESTTLPLKDGEGGSMDDPIVIDVKQKEMHLRLKLDRDWLALCAYHVALRYIVQRAEAEPWLSITDAAEMARRALDAFDNG